MIRLLVIVVAAVLGACGRTAPELGEFSYPAQARADPSCASKVNAPSASDKEEIERSIRYSVRTPANYRADYPHPLLMVYAPAGFNRYASERFYGLTRAATSLGFIVAYSDHAPLSKAGIATLGEVPAAVAAKWCVDTAHVYALGHSDGGSVSVGTLLLKSATLAPAAIAASGAGIRGDDLKHYTCPAATAIMVLHSREDERFPGYGEELAAWWAQCNGCGTRSASADENGCVSYARCAAPTRFCATSGAHSRWPGTAKAILPFFTEISQRHQ